MIPQIETLISPITDLTYREDCLSDPGLELRTRLEEKGMQCQRWTDAPSTRHPPHDHPYNHRVLCVKGWIEFKVDDDSYRLEPGDALDLPAEVTHSAITSPESSTKYWLIQPQ